MDLRLCGLLGEEGAEVGSGAEVPPPRATGMLGVHRGSPPPFSWLSAVRPCGKLGQALVGDATAAPREAKGNGGTGKTKVLLLMMRMQNMSGCLMKFRKGRSRKPHEEDKETAWTSRFGQRYAPKELVGTIAAISGDARKKITDAGFGKILDMCLEKISNWDLTLWLLEKCNFGNLDCIEINI